MTTEVTDEQKETFEMYKRVTALLWQEWYPKVIETEKGKPGRASRYRYDGEMHSIEETP